MRLMTFGQVTCPLRPCLLLREDLDAIKPKPPRSKERIVHAAGNGEVGAVHCSHLTQIRRFSISITFCHIAIGGTPAYPLS